MCTDRSDFGHPITQNRRTMVAPLCVTISLHRQPLRERERKKTLAYIRSQLRGGRTHFCMGILYCSSNANQGLWLWHDVPFLISKEITVKMEHGLGSKMLKPSQYKWFMGEICMWKPSTTRKRAVCDWEADGQAGCSAATVNQRIGGACADQGDLA